MDRERQKMEWEMKTQQADEQRRRDEERFRATTHEIGIKMQSAEEDLRRRQRENMAFLQVGENCLEKLFTCKHSLLPRFLFFIRLE